MTAPDSRPSLRDLGAPPLAGYRVLRSLARDERAEVLLGHRSTSGSGAEATGGEAMGAVALKVFPATDAGYEAALGECAALERARGDHVVDLLDLDADEESIRLIFERLPRGDLAELLRIRARFDAGEAVTLLAPLVAALQRLHTGGVAHGSVSARTVMFRDDGAPTLIGFSQSALFEPGAPEVVLEQVDAVRRDRAAIRALAMTVLSRVSGSRAREARALHDDVEGSADDLILPVLGARLFEVAAAVAVRFDPDEPERDAGTSISRAVPVVAATVALGSPPTIEGAQRPTGVAGSPIARWLSRIVPEALLQRVLDAVERSPAAAMAGAVARRWRSWTPARRRLAMAVTAAAATVVVLTAMIPAQAAGTAPAMTSAPSTPVVASSAAAEPASTDPVVVDDPVAATTDLMTARDRCLSSLSLRCLDQVDESGSSALEADQAAIRSAQQGGELPEPGAGGDDGSPVLIERLGDSALVRVGQTASAPSLLLVKGDAGWRIRDVIPADEAGDQPAG